MNTTYIHERSDGCLVEYRRHPHPVALLLEGRVLRPDGTPYADDWYAVSDSELERVARNTDIVALLAEAE